MPLDNPQTICLVENAKKAISEVIIADSFLGFLESRDPGFSCTRMRKLLSGFWVSSFNNMCRQERCTQNIGKTCACAYD